MADDADTADAIDIDSADEDKGGDGPKAEGAQHFLPVFRRRIGTIQAAEIIAQRDNAQPGQDGIADDEAEAIGIREKCELVQKGPAYGRKTIAGGMDAIEERQRLRALLRQSRSLIQQIA